MIYMPDIIQKIRNSTIHHGSINNRIFVLKLSDRDCPDILPELKAMAEEKGYKKIIAKVPSVMADNFIQDGYHLEAYIPGYFSGTNCAPEVFFLARFMDSQRAVDPDLDHHRTKAVLDKAAEKNGAGFHCISSPYRFRLAKKSDTPQMADLYRKVFSTYPFPIDDPDFLVKTMDHHCRYMGAWKDEKLIGLASADMDRMEKNAEMTDFAIHPEYRGQQLSGILLQCLENLIAIEGIKTAYTIARARSFGINITFSRAGYFFTGTLINNTNISGHIESMNVWYKTLLRLPAPNEKKCTTVSTTEITSFK